MINKKLKKGYKTNVNDEYEKLPVLESNLYFWQCQNQNKVDNTSSTIIMN